jgi:hypothetical protein
MQECDVILLYMCLCTQECAVILLHMCLLYMCPHTSACVLKRYMCVLPLAYRYAKLEALSYYMCSLYMCVLYMCPPPGVPLRRQQRSSLRPHTLVAEGLIH